MTFVLERNEGGYNFVKNLKKDIFMTPNSGQNRSSEILNSNNFRKTYRYSDIHFPLIDPVFLSASFFDLLHKKNLRGIFVKSFD